jgi:hypothetical protein
MGQNRVGCGGGGAGAWTTGGAYSGMAVDAGVGKAIHAARCVVAMAMAGAAWGCGSGSDNAPADTLNTGGAGGLGPTTVPVVPFDGGPTDVPLTLSAINQPDGDGGTIFTGYRLALQFGLGDAPPIDAWLDTGSEGIQVIGSALSSEQRAAIQMSERSVSSEYAGGVIATGVVGSATVTLGNRTTPQPISILVFEDFACAPNTPCSVDQMTTGQMADTLFNGYPAIVGAGLRNFPGGAPVPGSPIPQLPGQPSFIVEAPAYGSSGTGTLRIGPTADEVAPYPMLQLQPFATGGALSNGTPAWDDTGVPACVDDSTIPMNFCYPAVLDTGAPFSVIYLDNQSETAELAPGDDVSVVVGQTAAPLAQFQVTVSADPQPGRDLFAVLPPVAQLPSSLNLGLTLFFQYNVYFDPVTGQIGLLAK